MAGYSIQVSANTSKARDALKKLGKDLDVATRARKLVVDKTGLKDYQTAFKKAGAAAANAGKTIADSQEAIQKNIAATSKALNPRTFLTNAFQKAAASGMKLIDVTAKLTVAIYGINAAVGVLTRSFGGLFQQTIGRAAQLEATLLKTKTTLASTTDVFVNGNKITDPLEAINALSGQIDERVASIRKRTLELAGVTSSQVLEVFGLVAQQSGQIGASLKEAENLAISFAGALGTFGIPLYQARQEITSILQGNITTDSYLAKSLQITPEDIQKARTQVGGIVKFLEDKLGTAVAGQAIAAKQLEGVVSNIVEVWEEFGLAVGQVALQPLINGLTFVFETLIDSLDVIKKIGAQVGKIGAGIGSGLAGAAGFNSLDGNGTGAAAQRQAEQLFKTIEGAFGSLNTKLAETFDSINKALSRVLTELGKVIAVLTDAFAQLAGAVLDLGLEQIKAVTGALAQVAPILTSLVKIAADLLEGWADFLKLPLVKYLTGVAATFKILQLTGVNAVVSIVAKIIIFNALIRRTIKTASTVFIKVKQGVTIVIRAIGQVLIAISRVIQKLTKLGTTSGLVTKKAAADMKKLAAATRTAGTAAKSSAASFNLMGVGIKKAAVAMKGFIASTVGLLLLQVAISAIVFAITKLNEQASKTAEQQKLNSAIATLDRTAQGAADGGLSDLDQRLRDIASAEVNKEIDKIAQAIYELDEELEKLEARRDAPRRNIRGGGNTRSRAIADIEKNRTERAKLEKEIADLRKKLGIDAEEDVVETRKKQEVKLSKEIAAFNRQQADAVFARRQQLARKEVEIFKAAGELRIRQMEMANRKIIEGEEGASRTALEALNRYLTEKKRGELDIKAQEKNLEIAMQDRAKALEQYRVRIQEQINKMRQKIGEYEKGVADYRLEQAKKEGEARQTGGGTNGKMQGSGGFYTQGNIGPTSTGPHFDIKRSDGAFFERSALDKYVMVDGKPLSSATPLPGQEYGARRNYGGHAGWDYSFANPNARLTLQNGANWVRNTPGTPNGDEAAFVTPDGQVYKILHGKFTPGPGTRAGGGTKAPAGTSTPAGQMAVADTSSAQLEALDQKITSIDDRMVSIRESFNAITDQSNLDAISKAFGPQGGIEQLEDARDRAQLAAEAGENNTQAEQIRIKYEVEAARLQQERVQAEENMNAMVKKGTLSEETKLEVLKKSDEQLAEGLAELTKKRDLELEILGINQQAEALRDIEGQTESLQEQNELLQLRNRLEMEGVEGPVIEGEIQKARNQQLLNRLKKQGVKDIEALEEAVKKLNAEIDKGVQIQLAAQDPIQNLFKNWRKEISDTRAMVAQMAQTVANELGRAMSDALSGIIDGTKTAQEAFADMFRSIGQAFIDMATQMIAKALVMKALGILLPGAGGFNAATTPLGAGGGSVGGIGTFGPNFGFPGYAHGGRPTPGQPAIIGEQGPELWIPDVAGTVVPNDAFSVAANSMGGYNASNGPTNPMQEVSPEGDSYYNSSSVNNAFSDNRTSINKTSSRYEKSATAATYQEAVSAMMGSSSGSMVIETQVINEQEFVTIDQLSKSNDMVAQRTRAEVFAEMQNSVGLRKRIGI